MKDEHTKNVGTEGSRYFSANENSRNLDSKPWKRKANQSQVAQQVNKTSQWINRYPVDNYISNYITYSIMP